MDATVPVPVLISFGAWITAILALVISFLNYWRSRINATNSLADADSARKANVSSEFLKEFEGSEFTIVRNKAWGVLKDCQATPETLLECATYFIDEDFEGKGLHAPQPDTSLNDQTPLQCLRRLVSYWHRLYTFSTMGLTNPEILEPLTIRVQGLAPEVQPFS